MYSGFSGRRGPELPGKLQGTGRYNPNDLSPSYVPDDTSDAGLPYIVLKQSMEQAARKHPSHAKQIGSVGAKLKSDIAMMVQNVGASRVVDHILDHFKALTGMFRQGIAVRGGHIPISAYGIQPPAMDYRDNYWNPPYEIPVEPNYFPGYNIVTGTPRNGYYNVAGSYPAMMM